MEAVSANGAGGETAALSAFGRQWGAAEMFALGRRANENPPKLYTFNPKGFRRDVVEFHPAYHDLMRASIAAGLHASTWTATGKRASPPAEVARAARYYMAAQVESGHLCRSEALPITPDQIATQAVDAAKADAAILHLHARDPKDGRPSPDANVFMQFLPRINQACDAVVNITTGGAVTMTVEQRISAAQQLSPEMCLGSSHCWLASGES